MEEINVISFEGKPIRKIWHNEEWYFSVVDIVEALTDSPSPRQYWNIVKKRDEQLSTICLQLKLIANDGRKRLTDCANTEGILRIVMSIPSPKAEPLKLWLAQTGAERIEETENPELSFERMTEIYRAKGHTDKWIKERLQTISTRKELTDEWQARGTRIQYFNCHDCKRYIWIDTERTRSIERLGKRKPKRPHDPIRVNFNLTTLEASPSQRHGKQCV